MTTGSGPSNWRDTLREYVPRDWVFPIVLAAFVGVLVWSGREIRDFLLPPAGTVTLPSFVGQTLGDAQAEVSRLDLTSSVVAHTISDRYPRGVIVAQRPTAQTPVRQGRQVAFVVSDGIVARQMPDFRYEAMREVNLGLSRERLTLGKVTYVNRVDIPAGRVVDQDPAPLSNIGEGDVVNLVLSRGGAPTVHVPNFVGTNVDAARAAASAAGVRFGQIVWTPLGPGAPAHGTVVRQNIAPGTAIEPFEPVSIQVSAGPNESGYIVRQVPVLVSVPLVAAKPGQSLFVRLSVHDATGTYDLYRAYAQPGQKLDFMVPAVGTSVVDFYVNEIKVGETRLGNEPPNAYAAKASPGPDATP
jgi:serine/threonine-protein kinase